MTPDMNPERLGAALTHAETLRLRLRALEEETDAMKVALTEARRPDNS